MAVAVFGPPTISVGRFGDVLKQANSPVLRERSAAEYYAAIVGYGLDPAFMLAVFWYESNYGTAPSSVVLIYGTRNWGNTRSLSLVWPEGSGTTYVDVPGKGRYCAFMSWLGGLHDACNRLTVPNYPYAAQGARTVETIIPIWAPSSDNNNVARYIQHVLELMAEWKDLGTPVATELYADVLKLIAPGQNRPGHRVRKLHAFVWHETDNENPGATAEMHYRYISPGGGGRTGSSYHFCADGVQSLQFLPAGPQDGEIGWHIGDGADDPISDEAFFTIAGEVCVNSRSGYPQACRRMAKVAARVLSAWGLPVVDGVTLRKHGSYAATTHKLCPKHANLGDWGLRWSDIVAMVKAEYAALQPPAPTSGEADALKAFGDTIPFFCRGELLREGTADLTRFGGSSAERVCFYERVITHRLKGASFVMTLPLAIALRYEGKLIAYPDFPF